MKEIWTELEGNMKGIEREYEGIIKGRWRKDKLNMKECEGI